MKYKLEQFIKDRTMAYRYPGNQTTHILSKEQIAKMFKDTAKENATRYARSKK